MGALCFGQIFEQRFHLSPIGVERFSAGFGQLHHGVRFLLHEFFGDLYIAGVFKLGQVRGQIAPRQSRVLHQEHVIRTLNHVQVGRDQQPSRLVDDAINRGSGGFLARTLPAVGCDGHWRSPPCVNR